MKLEMRKKIENILFLQKELHKEIDNLYRIGNHVLAIQLLTDCQQTAIDVGTLLENIEKEQRIRSIVKYLEAYCDIIYQIGVKQVKIADVYDIINNLIDKVLLEIYEIPVTMKFLFLPYKASMWTSLESVWKAAKDDPECETVVMPIPYFKIGTQVKEAELVYEGDDFPKYVPVVDWQNYSIQNEKPDAIFIHNPYDDWNSLTTVHPDFYSDRLKQYTDCLVYVPYFTMSGYKKGVSDCHYVNKGTVNADKVVVQSEFVKNIYKTYGYKEDKLLALGSPKTDAVVNRLNETFEYPKEWKEKLRDKKVILLNTHLSYFPTAVAHRNEKGVDYAQMYHEEILEAIKENKECGLIWRPHPLLFSMAENNCKECVDYIKSFAKRLIESDNCVMDDSADYMMAFSRSDAMITTYSSLINEYMITGKPVMIFQTKQTEEAASQAPMDYRVNYFRFLKDGGMCFSDFIKMVVSGADPKREERRKMIYERAFLNLDGTVGKKVYQEIKEHCNKMQ